MFISLFALSQSAEHFQKPGRKRLFRSLVLEVQITTAKGSRLPNSEFKVLTVLSGRKEKGRIICFLLFELYLQE
jgi:hypothetical protein